MISRSSRHLQRDYRYHCLPRTHCNICIRQVDIVDLLGCIQSVVYRVLAFFQETGNTTKRQGSGFYHRLQTVALTSCKLLRCSARTPAQQRQRVHPLRLKLRENTSWDDILCIRVSHNAGHHTLS